MNGPPEAPDSPAERGARAAAAVVAVATVLAAIGWPAFVLPFAFAYNPALILQGGLGSVALATGSAAAGVFTISVALAGHFRGRIGAAPRPRQHLCRGAALAAHRVRAPPDASDTCIIK